MMSRPGTGMMDPLCATQFSVLRLRRRHLVVAAEHQLPSTMSKMALAPHSIGSVARQRGRVPPPHSSVKTIFVPSLLNVAECQYAKLLSTTASSRFGFTGSLMSSRMPLPEHAPAASPTSGYTVMSWHWFVIRELCVPSPWSPPCQRPAMLPFSSAKMRGRLTMREVSGRRAAPRSRRC
jgi:hypothetical protein